MLCRSRVKIDSETVIEDLMDYCIKKGIKDSCSLKEKDKSRYDDLLFAVAEKEGLDYSIVGLAVCHIAYDLMRLRFRSGEEREVVEDLINNYAKSLNDIPQITQKINELIEESRQDYYYDNPCAKPRHDVLDLIVDDNRERARSLRGI